MRCCVSLEGRGAPPRTEPEAVRAREVGFVRRMFRVVKSHFDAYMRDGSHAEGMTESVLHRS